MTILEHIEANGWYSVLKLGNNVIFSSRRQKMGDEFCITDLSEYQQYKIQHSLYIEVGIFDNQAFLCLPE